MDELRIAGETLDNADEARKAAQQRLDALAVKHHGPPTEGKLSYQEIGDHVGRSRSRVIRIVREHRRGAKKGKRGRAA